MKLRQTLACAALSLLLLISQQLGMAHALSHWSAARSNATQLQERPLGASKSLAMDQNCEQCLVFAQIASALDTPFHSFPAASPGAAVLAVADAQLVRPRTVCVFRSRAPPVLS